MSTIKRLLVANRGEIACRVLRTAKRLGLTTLAVYSDVDRDAPHVKLADEAYPLGGAPVAESYLAADKLLAVAEHAGADALHPGYGFLSENAAFARACDTAGICFIGPSAEAIDLMGDKARAKRAMLEAGVPCIPGYQGEEQAEERLLQEAKTIGYPLMVKATAGGGGRGMRLVETEADLPTALQVARSEAQNAFGAGELILEKALLRPRHVEVQVFGDTQGKVVHLGERDCSVQRRHQKVIEEAPCPIMTATLRDAMGAAAVAAAEAVSYVGAGTVEFLLDEDGQFYFLEMNTRLQVEHPVTELITGLDLVELQLAVAAGDPLPFDQPEIVLNGHAIEVRLYAEDPANDFLPATGPILHWGRPTGPGLRVDDGIESGGEVSPFYDPMVAKVIAYGSDRGEALRRLQQGLSRSALLGPANNRDFLLDALARQTFERGEATTAFLGDEYGSDGFAPQPTDLELAMTALLQSLLRHRQARAAGPAIDEELLNWSSSIPLETVLLYGDDANSKALRVLPLGGHRYRVASDTESWLLNVHSFSPHRATLEFEGKRHVLQFHASNEARLQLASERLHFSVTDLSIAPPNEDAGGDGTVIAPMHGQILDVFVAVGDRVADGQRLALLEAMKMQHELLANVAGTVKEIMMQPGTQVAADAVLIEIEPTEEG